MARIEPAFRIGMRRAVCVVITGAWALAACSGNANLGENPNPLHGAGMSGVAGTGVEETGGSINQGGSDAGGQSGGSSGGGKPSSGGAAQAGSPPTTAGVSGMDGTAGTTTEVGGAGGRGPGGMGGAIAGADSGGMGGIDSGDGVTLTAILEEDTGYVFAEWHNGTETPIFLRGCSTTDAFYRSGDSWVPHGAFAVCAVEGPAVEVAPGAVYRDPAGGKPPERGDNVWRLSGPYGIGCTAGAKFSEASCAQTLQATSINDVSTR